MSSDISACADIWNSLAMGLYEDYYFLTSGIHDYVEINFANSPLFDPFNEVTRMMSFSVTIIDDPLFELPEQFSLRLTANSSVDVQIVPTNKPNITIRGKFLLQYTVF